MCNCIEKMENKLREELPLKNDEFKGMVLNEVYFANKMIMLDTGAVEITLPVNLTYKTMSKGKEIIKKEQINVNMKYCPFCGEELDIKE